MQRAGFFLTCYAADTIASPAKRGSVDPKALMAIRNLELRARVVVEGFWNGLHRSPYHGFSVEFTEYRPYSPGEDTRYLDWRLYARSDRLLPQKIRGRNQSPLPSAGRSKPLHELRAR